MHIQQQTAGTEARRTHLVEFDDVGVIQHLHDLNFPVDLLQVHGIQLGLVNDLDGHLQERKSTKGRRDLVSRCSANKQTQQSNLWQKKRSVYNPRGGEGNSAERSVRRSGASASTKRPGKNLSQAV